MRTPSTECGSDITDNPLTDVSDTNKQSTDMDTEFVPISSLVYPSSETPVQIDMSTLREGFRLEARKRSGDEQVYFPVESVEKASDGTEVCILSSPVAHDSLVLDSNQYVSVTDMVHEIETCKQPCKLDMYTTYKHEADDDLSHQEIRSQFEEYWSTMMSDWEEKVGHHLVDGVRVNED